MAIIFTIKPCSFFSILCCIFLIIIIWSRKIFFNTFIYTHKVLVPKSTRLHSLPVYGTQLAYTILITHYIFPGHVHDIFSYIYRKKGNRCNLKKINYNKVNSNLFLSVSKVCASLISSRGIFPGGICPRG